ncbi:MAG: septum formation initiator family protein [Veillonella sp.]|uniref:FtsB family cell division protein n=1 Tax=Veillonella sp. TaxID=1926307 RepID=UPI0025D3028D|nr:septum formation initiator family protein [Veillonella sp.]MBS4913551.1 septum formation initiator family protein [Veillonella sp.]
MGQEQKRRRSGRSPESETQHRSNSAGKKQGNDTFVVVLRWIKIIVVVIGVYALIHAAYDWWAISQQQKQLQIQIEELQKKNEQLEEEKKQLQDPKAIEQVARDELGLVKPGEVPYVK